MQVFEALQTQWRFAGLGGIVGLDYSAIPPVMLMMGFNRREYHDVFARVRIMEREALLKLA